MQRTAIHSKLARTTDINLVGIHIAAGHIGHAGRNRERAEINITCITGEGKRSGVYRCGFKSVRTAVKDNVRIGFSIAGVVRTDGQTRHAIRIVKRHVRAVFADTGQQSNITVERHVAAFNAQFLLIFRTSLVQIRAVIENQITAADVAGNGEHRAVVEGHLAAIDKFESSIFNQIERSAVDRDVFDAGHRAANARVFIIRAIEHKRRTANIKLSLIVQIEIVGRNSGIGQRKFMILTNIKGVQRDRSIAHGQRRSHFAVPDSGLTGELTAFNRRAAAEETGVVERRAAGRLRELTLELVNAAVQGQVTLVVNVTHIALESMCGGDVRFTVEIEIARRRIDIRSLD